MSIELTLAENSQNLFSATPNDRTDNNDREKWLLLLAPLLVELDRLRQTMQAQYPHWFDETKKSKEGMFDSAYYATYEQVIGFIRDTLDILKEAIEKNDLVALFLVVKSIFSQNATIRIPLGYVPAYALLANLMGLEKPARIVPYRTGLKT